MIDYGALIWVRTLAREREREGRMCKESDTLSMVIYACTTPSMLSFELSTAVAADSLVFM